MSDKKEPVLAFVDVETTGLDCLRHQVIEIAVQRCNMAGCPVAPPYVTKIKPSVEALAVAEERALEVNRYTPEEWEGAPEESLEVWRPVWNSLQDTFLVGQNVTFDRGFIERAFRTYLPHEKLPWCHRFIDLTAYSALFAMELGVESWGLTDAYKALKGPEMEEHRAMSDVRRGIFLYQWMLAVFKQGFKTTNLLSS